MDCEKSKHISKTKDNHYTEVSLKIHFAMPFFLVEFVGGVYTEKASCKTLSVGFATNPAEIKKENMP